MVSNKADSSFIVFQNLFLRLVHVNVKYGLLIGYLEGPPYSFPTGSARHANTAGAAVSMSLET